ncbi:hypothetical protein AAHH79_41990, partial [Burkholderia pseudomallei]
VRRDLQVRLVGSELCLSDSYDFVLARQLLPTLERRAGRIVANGYPTGGGVADARVHGGPFPASSVPRRSSVGALASE